MFQTIDRNHNGEIDKTELRTAFSRSGVTVSNAKLDQFFEKVDKNNDGVISYTEWRYGPLVWLISLNIQKLTYTPCVFFS